MVATSSGRFVHLTTAGVSLLLDLSDGRLPIVLHWGRELPGLDLAAATAIRDADIPLIGPNAVDHPIRISVLPEHHTGYTGRPGISGSREGRAWSPAFATTSVELAGTDVGEWAESGAAELVVAARDDEAELELDLRIELLPSGLVRLRAGLTNTAAAPYSVDQIVLALPVPAQASELLDFAGRWGREKTPQRAPFAVGSHLREGRKGRTGADAATLIHAGTPGFGFEHGEVYRNVDASLSRIPVAILYVVANIALGIHLFHGVWSLFQSIGWNNPRFNQWRRGLATAVAAIVVVGNVSFPVMVLAGVVEFDPDAGTHIAAEHQEVSE